ncbi:hypothetical protein BC826DRAFT_1087355, partial [Russula brevipes]
MPRSPSAGVLMSNVSNLSPSPSHAVEKNHGRARGTRKLTSVLALSSLRAPPQRHSPVPSPTLHSLRPHECHPPHRPLDPRNSTPLHPSADIERQARSHQRTSRSS